MNYGLYLSAAGALSSLHWQDVIANNLANVNTVGFKPDTVFTRQRQVERLESPGSADPQSMLERIGGGLFVQPTMTMHEQGPLVRTGNDMDAALDGPGFFVVQSGHGAGADQVRLTRDGRFTRNSAGELVMTATGMRVMDDQNRPIRIEQSGPVQLRADGELSQNGHSIGRVQVVNVSDPKVLKKTGDGTFRADAATLNRLQPAKAQVVQGTVEGSAVDPIRALNDMLIASRAVQDNLKMMQYADNVMGQAINTLGRVA